MKYGDLIARPLSVIIFHLEWDTEKLDKVVVADAAYPQGTVSALEVNKNMELAGHLRINKTPAVLIYTHGQMVAKFTNDFTQQQVVDKINEIKLKL